MPRARAFLALSHAAFTASRPMMARSVFGRLAADETIRTLPILTRARSGMHRATVKPQSQPAIVFLQELTPAKVVNPTEAA